MTPVDRFSVSLDTELLAAFDQYTSTQGYVNRSEAIRDMIRDLLTRRRHTATTKADVSILIILCDQRNTSAITRLRNCLLNHAASVIGQWPVNLDQHRDLITIGLRGSSSQMQEIHETIQATRGLSILEVVTIPDDVG